MAHRFLGAAGSGSRLLPWRSIAVEIAFAPTA